MSLFRPVTYSERRYKASVFPATLSNPFSSETLHSSSISHPNSSSSEKTTPILIIYPAMTNQMPTLCEQAPSSSLVTNILSQLSDAEFATLSQCTTETLRDAHALDADVESLARVAVDNAEMLERLLEVQRGPQTRESREESRRIQALMERNEGLLEEIEGRVRGLRSRVQRVEGEVLRILGLRNENGARRGGE